MFELHWAIDLISWLGSVRLRMPSACSMCRVPTLVCGIAFHGKTASVHSAPSPVRHCHGTSEIRFRVPTVVSAAVVRTMAGSNFQPMHWRQSVRTSEHSNNKQQAVPLVQVSMRYRVKNMERRWEELAECPSCIEQFRPTAVLSGQRGKYALRIRWIFIVHTIYSGRLRTLHWLLHSLGTLYLKYAEHLVQKRKDGSSRWSAEM